MQLTFRSTIALALLVLFATTARADVGFDVTSTFFREGGGELEMTVITPAANLWFDAGEHATFRLGWEADVVTGASVAVVDAPASEPDVVTSATRLTDFRNTVHAGGTLRSDWASLDYGYQYGLEADYRSHSFFLTGRAELYERNTTLELSYARAWDGVCNLYQPRAQEAVERRRLPNADRCFGSSIDNAMLADDERRVTDDLEIHTFQGGWTQAWAPVFATQLTLTAQVLNGFQGNPYRAVWLGTAAAQENHPENRARYSGGLGARLWLRPLSGAIQAFARLYRDTWDVESVTTELGYEQFLADMFRIRVRGRYYSQSAAAFFSDDYVRFPRGQYFTGDRELATMRSWMIGGRFQWTVPPNDEGEVLGFLTSLDLVAKFDFTRFTFPDFHYGQADVPNRKALIGTLSVEAVF
jgi:hypothetical protein